MRKECAMKGKVGDRLVEEGVHVGDARRVGIITALRHDDGSPPYTVRWLDTGHESLVYPGPDARIEPAHTTEATG
jgi:Domain of unknown function (DUF1918)